MTISLKELRRLLRLRLEEARDIVGYDLAALKIIGRVANERHQSFAQIDLEPKGDIWAGMGLGSDTAAVIHARGRKRSSNESR